MHLINNFVSILLHQVGTSSVVYPAASFAPLLAMRGIPVAEFNLESTPVTGQLKYVHIHTHKHARVVTCIHAF